MRADIKRSYAERRLQYIMEGDQIQNIETTDGQLWYPTQSGYEMAIECEMEIIEEEQDEGV